MKPGALSESTGRTPKGGLAGVCLVKSEAVCKTAP